VHTEAELERVLHLPGVLTKPNVLLGINNRDLGTFKVDLGLTARLLASPPGRAALEAGVPMIAESGIFEPADVDVVQAAGAAGILVGESLVKQGDPEAGVRRLLGMDAAATRH
jgi:indole-3-glycerol phosphate synthase